MLAYAAEGECLCLCVVLPCSTSCSARHFAALGRRVPLRTTTSTSADVPGAPETGRGSQLLLRNSFFKSTDTAAAHDGPLARLSALATSSCAWFYGEGETNECHPYSRVAWRTPVKNNGGSLKSEQKKLCGYTPEIFTGPRRIGNG